MKTFRVFIFLLSTLLFAQVSHAKIYSWVDKDGKKHYGDKIPKEYLPQSKTIDIKNVNAMDAVKTSAIPDEPVRKNSAPHLPDTTDSAPTDETPNNSCAQQKLAYQESQACYARCKVNAQDDYELQNRHYQPRRPVNNVAACAQCTDMKKPNCD